MKLIEQILSVYGLIATMFGGVLLGFGLEHNILYSLPKTIVVGGILAFGIFSIIYVIFSLEERLIKAEIELKDRNNN